MLDKGGFDKWSSNYDKTVAGGDVAGEYPFAGYSAVLGCVKDLVGEPSGLEILDIGIGTGKFSSTLYAAGAKICGVDFSAGMIEHARMVMPQGEFHLFDFNSGLPPDLNGRKFDRVISAYAFHHLADSGKAAFIKSLAGRLKGSGKIVIADVAFETERGLNACREKAGAKWDDSEIYMVAETLRPLLRVRGLKSDYFQISNCAGILTLTGEGDKGRC